MLTSTYKLTIGNQITDTTEAPQTSTVVDLTVVLDMAIAADRLTLIPGFRKRGSPSGD